MRFGCLLKLDGIDDAMDTIERDNASLKGVLPKNYARPALDKARLGELIDLIGSISLGDKESRSKDVLGRVYEYFLGQFADAEGKKGGQFYTPKCIAAIAGLDVGRFHWSNLNTYFVAIGFCLLLCHQFFLTGL